MAESVITQVSREGAHTRPTPQLRPSESWVNGKEKKKKKLGGLFACLAKCFRGSGDDEGVSSDKAMTRLSRKMTTEPGLLGPPSGRHAKMKTLVLDLDETLVHSSFKPVSGADFQIPVEIDRHTHQVFVLKRPGVDQFLKKMAQHFELVVYTASLSKYADPVMDLLDKERVVTHRLFREACTQYEGNYVKDLSRLGRDLKNVIIIDNSPASYIFHPENAVPISSWFDDPSDRELLDLIPVLEALATCDDVTKLIEMTKHDMLNHKGPGLI